MVDALLQGRIKGPKLVEQIHAAGLNVPVIVLTVPQNPVEVDPAKGVHAVLSMPFSGFELMNRIAGVRKAHAESSPVGDTRVISVFAPKGGVGKTTIAFNLAVAMAQLEQRTVLIDGSVQFGDLRALLKVPVDAPSILDLPTDRIAESDLTDVLWRDPSGIDILLAPPRIEMAEMITPRDIDKVLSLLRRVYGRSSSTCRARSTTSTSASSMPATRSSRSSRTTRRRSTTRSRWPTRSARSAIRRRRCATS